MGYTEVTGIETISTTEWSLTTDSAGPDADTTVCTASAVIGLSALVAGDTFRLRLYEKARSGDTQELADEWFLEATGKKLFISPAFLLRNGWDFTLTKISATDRSITWSIREVT